MGRPPGCCCNCILPVPYLGILKRYLYPTQIADYESLSSGSWSSGDFAEYVTFTAGVPTYGGTDFTYYYYVLTVPEESTDDVSVILQPLRYAITEPASAAGDFDMWVGSHASYKNWHPHNDENVSSWPANGRQAFVSDTLLPVSDASHYDNTSPSRLTLFYMPHYRSPLELWDVHTSYNPTSVVSPLPVPRNWTVRPKYMWIRKNGSAYESLVDFTDFNDAADSATGISNGLATATSVTNGMTLYFAAAAATSLNKVAWDLDWVAGDTIELDVWFEMHARPRTGSRTGTKYVVAALPRHQVGTSARYPVRSVYATAVSGATYSLNSNPMVSLYDIDVSVGFNPATHTYSFDHGTHDWHAGDGSAGAQKARNISAATGSSASYVSIGTASSGTGNVTPGMPAGWAVDDNLWLICETANETVTAPTGWTSVTNSPQGTGTAGGTGATAMSVFWRRAETGDTAPTITDPGDHCIAQIVATRGGVTSGAPYDVTAGAVESSDIDPGEMPAVTTTVDGEIVLLCAAYHQNLNLVPPLRFASFTNAGLTGLTVLSDATYNVGNGGGLGIAIGTKTTAGSTGTTDVSWNQSSTPVAGKHAFLTIAIANTAEATGWQFTINSKQLTWLGTVNGGTYDGYKVQYTLDWGEEIAVLTLSGETPAGAWILPFQKYRPQNSGDYITSVTDRIEGSLVCGPCGVFDWLGTTVFERWDGTRASTYSPPALDPFYPESITVAKANQ